MATMTFDSYLDNVIETKNPIVKVIEPAKFDDVHSLWIGASKRMMANWSDNYPNITRQLILYAMGSPDCKLDTTKGILFIGPTGTGKTRFMQTLSVVIGFTQRFRFKIYSGYEMERAYRSDATKDERNDLEKALEQIMFGIDDLGEEHDSIKVYGSDINVGIEALTIRHGAYMKKGALTFATTNLERDALLKKYGSRIDSRIGEMFNVVYVKGNDLRKSKR